MKKSLFFVFMLLTTIISTQAQYKWLLLKGGVSIARQGYNSQDNTDYGSILGPVVGVGYEYGLNGENQLAIQPEILYFQKGSKYTYSTGTQFSSSKSEVKYRYSSIEVPILFKYSIGDVDEKRLSFLAGPSFGYILGGKYKSESSYTEDTRNPNTTFTDSNEGKIIFGESQRYSPSGEVYKDANRFGIGFHTGIAGNMKFGFGSLFADLRYCFGLSNFYKKDGDDFNFEGSGKHGYGLFTIGYMIPLDVN